MEAIFIFEVSVRSRGQRNDAPHIGSMRNSSTSPAHTLVSKSSRFVARILWASPIFLLALGIYQINVARQVRLTLDEGEEATAEVIEYKRVDRQDITFAEVSLRVRMKDGTTFLREKMSLPYSLSFRIKDERELSVRVMPGASQEVVIAEIAATQSRIAWMNAAISLVGCLLLAIAVFAWNRFLDRKGDPALAVPDSPRPQDG